MSKAHMNGILQKEMSPADSMDERIRRIDECVLKLMELPLDDRHYVISLVTELERQISAALFEERIAEKSSLQKFLDDLDDFHENEAIIGTNGNGHKGAAHS
jgi:hypothetical protein